jgi:hypothetical protein
MTKSPMAERVILTEFDSSSQTYRSTSVSKEMVPAMREHSPIICGEDGVHVCAANTDTYSAI